MNDQLRLPEGWTVPVELEQAFTWMDAQGWTITNKNGLCSTPYAGERQLGVVFTPTVSLEGWFEATTPGADQLVPIAEIGGDGSIGALWRANGGQVRVVGLGSEGEAFLLGESVLDFLRMAAIGYTELTPDELGQAPQEQESVEALAPFRRWVTDTFAVEVPQQWPAVGEDEFTDWVAAQLGWETASPMVPVAGGPRGRLDGSAQLVLDALGDDKAGDRLLELITAAGVTPDPERWATGGVGRFTRALGAAGLEVEVERGTVATIWVETHVDGSQLTAPRSLLAGIDEVGSRESVAAVLGEPEKPGAEWDRYVVQGRYLHFEFSDGALARLTAMVESPDLPGQSRSS